MPPAQVKSASSTGNSQGSQRKRVLTGSRPTGSPHLGNYYGAFRQIVALQKGYDFFFFLADFHALNSDAKPDELRANSYDMIATLVACGLDPASGLVYAQSSVPEVTELSWIIGCQAPMGMMMRAHSYKDAVAKGVEVNMGVFNYPVLMSADILLFDADVVPVGQDQKQHLEMTRDFAQRFNNRYGETFVVPEPMIGEDVATVPGADGEKMSKSKNNVVSIFASDAQWKKQVMAIVTAPTGLADPKDPETCNVFAIYKLMATPAEAAEMAAKYRAGGYGYGHAKLELLEKLKQVFGPMRDKYFDLMKRPDDLRDIVLTGSKAARAIAKAKLERVQQAVGVIGRPFD
jgi:tryptophanyl-tRNA synthetase